MAERAPMHRMGAALAALLVLAVAVPAAADHFLLEVSGEPTNATFFGYAVASGDLNADGFPDLIVGAHGADVGGTDRGEVRVFFGGATTDSIADLVLHGMTDGEFFGVSLAADGDLNGDGIDDLVVGAPEAPNGGTRRGRVAVYFGAAAFDSVPDLDLDVPDVLSDGSRFGYGVAYVEDTNGDGFEDLIVGAPDAGLDDEGAAYLFLGDTNPGTIGQRKFQGELPGDDFGHAVGGGGDVNGDGYADILVGAQDADFGGGDSGAGYLFLGGDPLPDAAYAFRLPGVGTGDDFGFSMSAGGDVNGDGYDDWVVAAIENEGAPGYVKLYLGSETGTLDGIADLTFTGYSVDAWYGRWVELADMNADGYADVVVSGLKDLQAYIYYGGPNPDTGLDVRLDAPYSSFFGEGLDIVDDLDGDGLPEIAIGEYRADAEPDGIQEGRAYIVSTVLAEFDPVIASPGVATQVTLNLASEISWGTAKLFWRPGGSAAFDSTVMAGTGNEPRTATIPGGVIGRRGVQYWARVGVATAPVYQYRCPPSGFGNVDVTLGGDTVVQLQPERHEMIGLSMRAADPSPEAVFDELGAYDRAKWRYGVYNGSTYDEVDTNPPAPPAAPGQGFWIVARDAATIRTDGFSADLSADEHSYWLRPNGWTQIANPFSFEIALPAVLPPGVVGNLISWNGTGYESFQTRMQPGRGYWIFNGSLDAQVLTILAREAGSPKANGTPPHHLRDGEPGWSLAVDVTVGERTDWDHRFGQRHGATDAVDALDFPDVPPPPSGYVQTSFVADDGQPLMVDYRAPSGAGARWRLALRSDLAGRAFSARFRDTADLPAGWRLVATDRTGGIVQDLARDPELTGLVPAGEAPQEWFVLAGTESWIEAAAGEIEAEYGQTIREFSLAVGPNPLPPGVAARIVLTIPQAGPVDVTVHDVGGRLVRRLASGPADRGVLRLAWDGTDRFGRTAGSGVYFLKAVSGDSQVTGKITRIR